MPSRDKSVSTIAVLLLSTLLAAPPALADPPGHAPAYGQRARQQQPYYGPGYDVRRGNCNGDDVGTVLGAVAGGAIGSQVAKGDDQMIGTIVGAVIGGVLGHQVGRSGDPGCNSRSIRPGRAGVPVRAYYPDPRRAYAVPDRRSTYVVNPRRPVYVATTPRRVYAAPYRHPANRYASRNDDHRPDNRYASRRDDHRPDQDCRRDNRGRGNDGKRGCR